MRLYFVWATLLICAHGVRLKNDARGFKEYLVNQSSISSWSALRDFFGEGRWLDLLDQSVQPKQIGSGTFGVAMKVVLAPICKEPEPVVVKQIKLVESVNSKMLLNELQIQQALSGHPNIVDLYDYHPQDPRSWEAEGSVFVMMPLAGGGEIDKAYAKEVQEAGIKTGRLNNMMEWQQAYTWRDHRQHEADHATRNMLVSKIALDIFAGLSHVHKHGFVHRDLKPGNIWGSHENCMTRYSAECKYMLGDFGMATHIHTANDVVGTAPWFPPEIPSGGHPWHCTWAYPTMRIGWTPAGDVYALGLVLLSIVSGEDVPAHSLGTKVFNIREYLSFHILGLGQYLTELIVGTLAPEPFHRINAVRAHELAVLAFGQATGREPPTLTSSAQPLCIQECARMRCCYNLRCNILEGKCDEGSPKEEVPQDTRPTTRRGTTRFGQALEVVANWGLAWIRDAPADEPLGIIPPKVLPSGKHCYNRHEIPVGERLVKGLLIAQEELPVQGPSQTPVDPGAQAPSTPPPPFFELLSSGQLRVSWTIPRTNPGLVSISVSVSLDGVGTFVIDATDGKNVLVQNGGQPLRPDANSVEFFVQPGVTCQAMISFRNSVGPSLWSPLSASVTVPVPQRPVAPPPPPPLQTAPRPTLALTESNCLIVSWTIPATTPAVQTISVSLRVNTGQNFMVDTTGGQIQLVASGGQPLAAPATSVKVCVQPGFKYDALISMVGGNTMTDWSDPSDLVEIPNAAPSVQASASREYVVGDPVHYWSPSSAKWFDCYIIKVDARGVQVDGRVGDPIPFYMLEGRVQPRDGPKYVEGDVVQYLSATTGLWFDAEVSKVDSQGIQVDLKPGHYISFQAMREKIRPRPVAYKVGDVVQYYSTSHKQWVDTSITRTDKTRGFEVGSKPGVFISIEEAKTKLKLREARAPQYSVGDLVQYYSTSNNQWVDASVTFVDPTLGYELDVKRGAYISLEEAKTKIKQRPIVQPQEIGASVQTRHSQGFQVGAPVWYYSTGTRSYEPAIIIAGDANGLFIDIRLGQPIPPQLWSERLKHRILVS